MESVVGRKYALVVIDMQNGFVNPSSAHVVPIVSRLVQRWQPTGNPIIFTRYFNYSGSPYERLIGWAGLKESPSTDLVDEIAVYAGDSQAHLVNKTGYTALTQEGSELIHNLGVTDIFACGIATDGCVLKTVLDTFEAGITPWVVADACASNASRHPAQQIHESALLLMSRLVGKDQVIDSQQALAMGTVSPSYS